MVGHLEKAKSTCAFVPYLSHGTVANLKIWLRGPATSGTCSCGVGRHEAPRPRKIALLGGPLCGSA